MEFEDRSLVCEDCGEEFIFSAEEQEFYMSRGFQTPKRCKPCRSRRKEERRGGFREKKMYTVTCADCGQVTEVPFKPRENRPVYCRECYQRRKY
jgi:CxxC-x17-CxxC domain-containing protein